MNFYIVAIVASLGSLLFGFDTAVISGTTQGLTNHFDLSSEALGFTVASALFGTLIGAFAVGKPADKWGRKPAMVAIAFLYFASALGCAFSNNWHLLIFWRILGGLAVGGASVIAPLYITESAPAQKRGVLVAVAQLNIVLGILMAYLSNYLIINFATGLNDSDSWRWMFGVEALPALLFIISSLMIPESPRWLIAKGKTEMALQVLKKLGHKNPESEFAAMESARNNEKLGGLHQLFQRKYAKPLALALMIAAFNQLDGINAILYYSADIFRMAGFNTADALAQSVWVGVANLIMTIVGMMLIDKIGRKNLLLIGSVTFVLSHSLAAYVFATDAQGWIVLIALMGVVGSHAYSQGAVVWVVINEILPNKIRAIGASACIFFLWSLAAIISWVFPIVAESSGSLVFGFFGLMMVLQFILVYTFLPETKGISLEKLEQVMLNKQA